MKELGTYTRVPAFICSVFGNLPNHGMSYLAGQMYDRNNQFCKGRLKIINFGLFKCFKSLNIRIMALITCPECGASVSDKAEKCPQCAYPLNKIETELPPPPEVVVHPKEGCFLQTMNAGCIVVAVILGIVGLIVVIALMSS